MFKLVQDVPAANPQAFHFFADLECCRQKVPPPIAPSTLVARDCENCELRLGSFIISVFSQLPSSSVARSQYCSQKQGGQVSYRCITTISAISSIGFTTCQGCRMWSLYVLPVHGFAIGCWTSCRQSQSIFEVFQDHPRSVIKTQQLSTKSSQPVTLHVVRCSR